LISEGKTIPSKGEIKSNLKALMKAEPKLVKAFNKGKEQGKAAINDLI
jgi:ribosomal protein S24E